MKNKTAPHTSFIPREIVIPREKAVFWMDGRGRWQNRHGRFEHKGIIDHFNHAIRKDKDGYYVTQIRGNLREKVYFRYEETPLFVQRIIDGDPIRLALNTGRTIAVTPTTLFIRDDQLYQRSGNELIKFSGRALMALAPWLDEAPSGWLLHMGGRAWPIPDHGTDQPDNHPR